MGTRSIAHIRILKTTTAGVPTPTITVEPHLDLESFRFRRRTVRRFCRELSNNPEFMRAQKNIQDMVSNYRGSICNLGAYSEGYGAANPVTSEVLSRIIRQSLHRGKLMDLDGSSFVESDQRLTVNLGDYRLKIWNVRDAEEQRTGASVAGYEDWVRLSFGLLHGPAGGGSVRIHRDGTLYLELDSALRENQNILDMMALLTYAMDSNQGLLRTMLFTEEN